MLLVERAQECVADRSPPGSLLEPSDRSRLNHAAFPRSARKFLAARLTRLRKCRTTAEGSPRRDARFRTAFGWLGPLRRRYATPSMIIRCMEAGTAEIPRPGATRLSADVMRGASWPRRGRKPALRHAAVVASYSPGPC